MIPSYMVAGIDLSAGVQVVRPPAREGFDTPPPVYVEDLPLRISEKLVPSSFDERQRVHTAAHTARKLYPGPVGELLHRELTWWAESGWRLGPGIILGVVEQILAE